MSSSGNVVNYNVRTSKAIERKMLLFALKELFKYFDPSTCRYIGMGSTYFTDFKLLHKELNIHRMISFELESALIERAEYNKPYKCIKILPGKSTKSLTELEWGDPQKDFIWMDYDGNLEYDMFNDVETIFTNISAGSIYLMTCNKQLRNYSSVEQFNEVFEELVPNDISQNDFSGENDSKLIRRMFINKINDVIISRNYSLSEYEKLIFRQLFFITYKDGAPMMSFGGLIDKQTNDFSLEKYNLNNYDFISMNDSRFIIDPPALSYKEMILLNTHLPNSDDNNSDEAAISFIPLTDRNKYRKLYKYMPTYMDVVY